MADNKFDKVLLPIIKHPLNVLFDHREQMDEDKATKGARWTEVEHHQTVCRDMDNKKLEEMRVFYFDRWCWETGDPTDRAIFTIYDSMLKIKRAQSSLVDDLLSVQPMTGPTAQKCSLSIRYEKNESEDDS